MPENRLDNSPGPGDTGAVSTTLRLGTRGSDLALTQSTTVAEALAASSGLDVRLVRIRTEGDRSTASLTTLGGTGVFAAALREALLAGDIDVAVHSLKDLPSAPLPGLEIAAVPVREDPRDALCAREGWTLTTLPVGARVGTGSPRRAAQLRLARPDLDVVDIRGNVPTRLARVAPGDLDAVVLAAAGLSRLGLLAHVTDLLPTEVMLPAPGQGALAVECRAEEHAPPLADALREVEDPATRLAVVAEREVLRVLEAGCTAPVAAHARVDDTGRLLLTAGVFGGDGLVRSGAAPAGADALSAARELGATLAHELLDAGAVELAGLPPRSDASPGRL